MDFYFDCWECNDHVYDGYKSTCEITGDEIPAIGRAINCPFDEKDARDSLEMCEEIAGREEGYENE